MQILANTIAISCVLHYLWSYYWNCYRRGYKIDIWHYSLLFNLFIIHIMLPFSRSNLNVFALGHSLQRTQSHVNEAYFISALGYAGIVAGGGLWRLRLGIGLRRMFSRVIELPVRSSLFLLNSRRLLFLNGILVMTFLTATLLFYFKTAGFGFNLRGLLLVMPALRPLAQFTAFYSVLIGSYCLARYTVYKEKELLFIFISIVCGLLFFGERGNLIAVCWLSIAVHLVRLKHRLSFSLLALGAAFTLLLVFALDALRQSANFSINRVIANMSLNVFYGNSFSDTRDFALVLSFWNGKYFLGKTYIAGLFAFIPRFLSPYRDKWALGVVTATMAGFRPTEHPGLRVGLFGEAFLNFGLLGVILVSLFIGSIIRLIDLRVKESLADPTRSGMNVYSYFILGAIISVAQNSVGASSFYSTFLILFGSWLIAKTAVSLKLPLY